MGLTKHAATIATTPIKVVGWAVGAVRGTAVAAAELVMGHRNDDPVRDFVGSSRPTPDAAPPAGEPIVREPGPIPTPADLAERVAPTEDVTTPAGTTGAGRGYNPDTTETDLYQPETEPLMDPATTKAVASESATLQRAADPDKS
jgi:hypothetical protein